MKKILLCCSMFCFALINLWGVVLAVQDDFGFGKDDSVIATKDINVGSTDEIQREGAVLDIVKSAVNRVLGVSALIALIFLIYGGVRMVIAWGNEESYNQWFAILKSAAIWIALLWIARFMASLIFWMINTFATTAEWSEWWTSE